MKTSIKKSLAVFMLMLSTLMISTMAFADAPKKGVEFDVVVRATPTSNPAKIEVTEIFWYGCSHCYNMDAPLNAWVKKLPSDVYFKRVPGLPNPSWAPAAKTFYAMETLGVLEKLHTPLFDAIHKQKVLDPTNEQAAIAWVTAQSGLDKLKVEQAFKSFSMNASLSNAAQVFRNSGATGVPTLMIDGKYLTSSTMAGGNDQALKVADYIIDNVRKDKAAKAPAVKK
jgi:protein dithiol oxidoreductase (disulfide-forming)